MSALADSAATVPGGLPAAADRHFPIPGYEESERRIGPLPATQSISTAYAFQYTQAAPDGGTSPVAWSPCRPIHYVINPVGAPEGFPERIADAVAEVSSITGLVFADDGTSDEAPTSTRAAFLPELYGDRWAPVLIQFTDKDAVPRLAGKVGGLAAAQRVDDPHSGVSYFVSGVIHLDTELLSLPDIDGVPVYAKVLLHELGHVVGLAHVEDPAQLMFADGTSHVSFQPGDIAGLTLLGQGACAPGI